MKSKRIKVSVRAVVWLAMALSLCMALLFASGTGGQAQAASGTDAPTATCPPGGQCFEDVPSTHTFYAFINNLYIDDVISGYACGGPGEPCVPPNNRPYYRPGVDVTRGQMSKFVENGRRNIDVAIGQSLVLSTTAFNALVATTNSGGEAIDGRCITDGVPCYAVQGSGGAGNSGGFFSAGHRGIYASADDDDGTGVDAHSSGANGYAGYFLANDYRAGYFESNNNGRFSLYVAAQDGPTQGTAALNVYGPGRVEGVFYALGGCNGCFDLSIVQNVDSAALEPGDVVTIVGSSAPVQGDTPLLTVKKADGIYDTGVVGIVDSVMYVPDPATRAAYLEQEQAIRGAREQRTQIQASSTGENKADPSNINLPKSNITDEQGTVHAIPNATQVEVNGYGSVVTQGVYKAIKVDASFGSIKAGDLLTTSPNAGYAMKATDKTAATGAIIGKALGDLDSGTGTIAVMVTLK